MAANTGNSAIVQMLIEENSDINAANNEGQTAFYQVVTHCDLQRETNQGKRKHQSNEKHSPFSESTAIAYILLKAGAHLKNTKSISNPPRVLLNPRDIKEPNFQLLKILSAAGVDVEGIDTDACNESLRDLARKFIRQYLKKLHPERNLYNIVSQLSLPHSVKFYLLFYTLLRDEEAVKVDKKDFLSKT